MGAASSRVAARGRDPREGKDRLGGRPAFRTTFPSRNLQRVRGLDAGRLQSRLHAETVRALGEIGAATDRESAVAVLAEHAAFVARLGRAGRAGEVLLARLEDLVNDGLG
jgi:trimethylamine:corrinoid methyltransferase-like protein